MYEIEAKYAEVPGSNHTERTAKAVRLRSSSAITGPCRVKRSATLSGAESFTGMSSSMTVIRSQPSR
jgi:hypothetical protein